MTSSDWLAWGRACVLVFSLVVGTGTTSASAGGGPARPLPSPAAAELSDSEASQYWDLTVELESGHRIFARFQITNQGPGENNGTAIGHVVKPNGDTVQFRNGRLESGWTLSEDRLDLDVGKCHLDMHPPRYRLRVNKSDVRIRLDFYPNALKSIPDRVTGKRYHVDLLALGAPADGSLRFESKEDEFPISGRATLTHTVAALAETDLALRRFELIAQTSDRPLYAVQFLDEDGDRSSWASWLDARCDPAFAAKPFPTDAPQGTATATKSTVDSLGDCIQVLGSTSKLELTGSDSRNGSSNRGQGDPYWTPSFYSLIPSGDAVEAAEQLTASVEVGERLLKYEALDDLPGAIRWIARLSTEPRRIWSQARFVVTLPPSLDSEPQSIQTEGVAIVSYLNPVTKP